ncbi:MAG TPA: hypothetical protein VGB83_08000 [Actinomycetota bacterium]
MDGLSFPFRPLPGSGIPRPVVDVFVGALDVVPIACLIDTGSIWNRFPAWLAREASVDLRGAPASEVSIGGHTVIARGTMVTLRIGRHEVETHASFCKPWPWDFGVLGTEGFLRWFDAQMSVANRTLTLAPA